MTIKKQYSDLGKLLQDVKSGKIAEGQIITNETTNERVVLHEGNLHFITLSGYISEEVPLVSGMIMAEWSTEEPEYKLTDLKEALEAVAEGVPILIHGGHPVESIGDFLLEVDSLGRDTLNKLNHLTYRIPLEHISENKFARKTTETEAWAILMDSEFKGFGAQDLADKYQISLRNVYYILDGTHYNQTHHLFKTLQKEGRLTFGDNK